MESPGAETSAFVINVLLVDDHEMFREGLARLLEKQPDLSVVGQCSSSSEALVLLKKSGANMVLLDVDLGSERALDFVVEARRRGFEGKVLVLTAGISGQEAVQLVQSGVMGILHKHHSAEELRAAIRQAAGGGVCLEQEYLPFLFRSVDRTRTSNRPRLTDREKEILRFVFQGLTNKGIGAQLEISEGAVKAALRLLFEKLGARTRAQLVKIALEQYRDQL
jgi:two-component system, NarL family, nitrate/nitrite response regulator NarL